MLCEETCIFIIRLMLGVISITYYFENLEFRWFFLDFRNSSWSQTAQPKNPKIAFREEFLFQIYNSFSTNSKQNGLLLISNINTKIGVIFGSLEDQFWRLEQSEKFRCRTRMLRALFFGLSALLLGTVHEKRLCACHLCRVGATYRHHTSMPNLTAISMSASSPPCCLSCKPLLPPCSLPQPSYGGRTHFPSSNPPYPHRSLTEDQSRMAPTSSSTILTISSSPET